MKRVATLLLIALIPLAWAGAAATPATQAMPALPNLSQPEPDRHASGAVTAADVEPLKNAGIRHVINLRAPQETPDFDEAAAFAAAGIRYNSLPIAGADDLDRDHVHRFDALLKAQAGEPSLIHCGSSNRVGALMALRAAWIDGLAPEAAIAEGKRWGLASLEPVVREKIAASR